jgi:hypothetical protein
MSSLQLVTTNIVRGTSPSGALQPGLTARIAYDEQTRRDAYAIRHASYLSGGYIDPQPDGLFSDADDLMPNSRCVVVYRYGKPVASVRLCTLDMGNGPGWDEIPASRIFPEAVAALAADAGHDRPARLTEINRLVRHPDHANDFQLVFVLFRFVSYLVIESQSDMMLNCVRRNHTSFYRRMHFNYVEGPRRYAGVKFETNLMVCPEARYNQLMTDIPFVATTSSTKQAYAALLAGDTVNVSVEG